MHTCVGVGLPHRLLSHSRASARSAWPIEPRCGCRNYTRTLSTHSNQLPQIPSRLRSPQRVYAADESSVRTADPTYMEEYKELKDGILGMTRKSGAGIAAYLLLTTDGEAALCALLGMLFSNVYLLWLFYDVDNVKPTDRVALREAEQIQIPGVRTVAKLAAAYQHALRPRLLVPFAAALLISVYNKSADQPLELLYQGCVLVGFLSYKIALLIKIIDENSPKGYKAEEMSRPTIERFDDQLDNWGRPKKQIIRMPTDALPDNIDTSKLPEIEIQVDDDSK